MRVGIIGAGIAGLACADRLAASGIAVTLFDKGNRPGGRLASVTIGDMSWDLGAQSLTAQSVAFAAQTAKWLEAAWLAPWPDGPKGALVGMPSMGALVANECARFDVRFGAFVQRVDRDKAGWHIVERDLREGPFSALVVAVPAEQAAALLSLHDLDLARDAASVRSLPCWTLMAAFSALIPWHGNVLRSAGAIATATRSNSRPGRSGTECWVLHADADWSRAHLELPREEIAELLLAQFAETLSCVLPPVVFLKAHRWRFALPFGQPGRAVWNEQLRLGACGDWCTGATIEDAWLSGNAIGDQIGHTLRDAQHLD